MPNLKCTKISFEKLEKIQVVHRLVLPMLRLSGCGVGTTHLIRMASNGEYVMNTIDLTPLYRNSVGFDRMASLLDNALRTDSSSQGYPPYNIEVLEENRYAISLAVAGFTQDDLDINIEKGVLTVRGKKDDDSDKNYLHRGIANRAFERKFNLADYIEVTNADLDNGLLTISLLKEIPEAMKPKRIAINQPAIDHGTKTQGSVEGDNSASLVDKTEDKVVRAA